MRLLVVEDNESIAGVLGKMLAKDGYVIDIADSLKFAKSAIDSIQYDLVILDRMLPDGEGLDLIRYCEKYKIKNRYLILSALNEIGQRVEGLDAGAHDYVVKPFEPVELLARVRAALRNPLPERDEKMKYGNIVFDNITGDILLGSEPFMIPRKEKLLLDLLIKRFNRLVSREALTESIYSFDDEITSNSLESHVSKLRKKLLEVDAGVTIHTVRGVGYILKEGA